MLKRVVMALAFTAAVLAGGQVGTQVATATRANAACPDTECELSSFCADNPGGGTYCDGGTGGTACKTRGCVIE